MIVDVAKYVRLGQERLRDNKQEQEKLAADAERERIKENSEDWEERLAPALELLPEELRPLVTYDPRNNYLDLHIVSSIGTGYPNMPVIEIVDCAPISILLFPNSLPKFAAQKADLVYDQDTLEPIITYRDGTLHEDPLMAIAEAADFAIENAKTDEEYDKEHKRWLTASVPSPDCSESESCRYGIPDPNHVSAWVINMPWGSEYVFNGRWGDASVFADITCKSHWSYDPDEELTGAWTIREVRPGSSYGPYTAVTM